MEKLMIEFDGNYIPKKMCSIARNGEVDEIDGCSDYCIDSCNGECTICAVQECFNRLAEYEKFELDPEQITEIDKLYAEKCREVAMLKKQIKMLQAAAGMEKPDGKETT